MNKQFHNDEPREIGKKKKKVSKKFMNMIKMSAFEGKLEKIIDSILEIDCYNQKFLSNRSLKYRQ